MNFSPEVFKQLLSTFQAELDEGVDTLVNGLVELEKSNEDSSSRSPMIESLFRTAHNLKGSSRGLGIMTVGDIAHQMESLFSGIKSSKSPVSKQAIDTCLDAADKMQEAMQCFMENKPLSFNIDELKNRILQITNLDEQNTNKNVVKPEDDRRSKQDYKQDADADVSARLNSGVDRLNQQESIRVQLRVIDRISELSDEIQVSKIKIDDYSVSAKSLKSIMRDFNDSWRLLNAEINKISGIQDYVKIQKLLLRTNDELMNIRTSLEELSVDLSNQSNDFSKLSLSIMDEVARMRLVPVKNYLTHLPRYVRELADQLHKNIEFNINGGDVYIDKYVLEGLKDPINHLIRNAIDHGIESTEMRKKNGKTGAGKITINVIDAGSKVYFEISDDGAGINYDKLRELIKSNYPDILSKVDSMTDEKVTTYIFESGISTKSEVSSISGRGVGMDAVKKNIQLLKGSIDLKSKKGQGTTFIITVPLSLSSERGLIVKCEDQIFVIPTYSVDRVISVTAGDIVNIQGGHAVLVSNHPVILKSLANIIGIGNSSSIGQVHNVIIIKVPGMEIALGVDQILGEREIVIKPIEEPLSSIPAVSGVTLLDRNQMAIIFNPGMLIKLALKTMGNYYITEDESRSQQQNSVKILVVDDSITTRTLEKNILESKGYDVSTAVNGQEAWEMLSKMPFSLIITDINMPVMDGFELTEKIKQSEKYSALPVIIVTSLGSDAEKARGIEAGADAYIIKNEFESGAFLKIIEQMI